MSQKLILLILFTIFVAMFSVDNVHTVEVHYHDLRWHEQSISLPMNILVLGSFALGFFFTFLFTVFGKMRLKSQVRRKSREVVALQKDIDRLKPSSSS